ncbi:hypothetical protein YC2023_121550 [Brassica napus]
MASRGSSHALVASNYAITSKFPYQVLVNGFNSLLVVCRQLYSLPQILYVNEVCNFFRNWCKVLIRNCCCRGDGQISFLENGNRGICATRCLVRNLISQDDPASFTLNPNFSLFPQFAFNLRGSQCPGKCEIGEAVNLSTKTLGTDSTGLMSTSRISNFSPLPPPFANGWIPWSGPVI